MIRRILGNFVGFCRVCTGCQAYRFYNYSSDHRVCILFFLAYNPGIDRANDRVYRTIFCYIPCTLMAKHRVGITHLYCIPCICWADDCVDRSCRGSKSYKRSAGDCAGKICSENTPGNPFSVFHACTFYKCAFSSRQYQGL